MDAFSPYQVERINAPESFLALKKEWIDLASRIPRLPVFLTWEWESVWWKHFSKGLELFVLVVRDHAGQLKGIAPLVKGRWPCQYVGLQYIRFLGHGIACPIDMGMIVDPKEPEPVFKVLADYLLTHCHEWDFLDIKGSVPESCFEKYVSNAEGFYLKRAPVVCPVIPLTGDWAHFFNGLDRKFRQKLRSSGSSIERDYPGQVKYCRVSGLDELSRGFKALVAMHKERMKNTSFGDPRFVAFHEEMTRVLLERQWLRFYELRVGEQSIAVLYCYLHNDVFAAYQAGFDPRWSHYNPGHLLAAHVIREAIAGHAREFNWLGGDQRYKFHWTSESRISSHFVLTLGWRARLLASAIKFLGNKKPEYSLRTARQKAF